MIEFSDQGYMTPNSSVEVEDALSSLNSEPKLSLTALWEFVVREKCLPEHLDLDLFFRTVHERLHDPEWEVRQHALRVLVDCIPAIEPAVLDLKIQRVLNDLVANLGHLGPAVRKGAVDSLRAYVNHTERTDTVIHDLVERGVEKSLENRVQTNVVLGIILSLPFLINANLEDATVKYIIHRLLDKIEKVIHQETVLRSLLRIREIVGYAMFDECLRSHESYNSKQEFDLLCQVYDLHTFRTNRTRMIIPNSTTMVKTENYSDVDKKYNLNEDRIILETEIQLESGSAITMKIHEENAVDKNKTFKVLPDENDPENYDFLRRTPRRVRFGGEVVKLRTPDSDSNNQSDNEATISIISDGRSDQPMIEIKYIENETKTTTRTSRIPVPVKQTQSAPNSPNHSNLQNSKIYKSSPNLSKSKPHVPKMVGKSRIPRRFNTEVKKTIEAKIQITIKDTAKKTAKQLKENFCQDKVAKKIDKAPEEHLKVPERKRSSKQFLVRRDSREDEFSPIPIHNEIEVLHNLARSPSPIRAAKENPVEPEPLKLPAPVKPESPKLPEKPEPEPVKLPELVKSEPEEPTRLQSAQIRPAEVAVLPKAVPDADVKAQQDNFASFQVCNSSFSSENFYDFSADSPIPTKDSGDCLTCSSSGSDAGPERRKPGVEEVLDSRVLDDIQNMDDFRARQRGLEELLRTIHNQQSLESLKDRLPTLLYILFTAEQQPYLQPTAEQALSVLFENTDEQCLTARLHQIALSLSKTGTPAGVRLAILLMQRIPPKLVVDQLMNDSILRAKSSKVREGALQILMAVTRIFPSTDLDVEKSTRSVVSALRDRKRRVRQAALETLGALAQISSNVAVMDIANETIFDWPESEQIAKVIRTRLSRKQLPNITMNGHVRYSSPAGTPEIEWLARGSSSPKDAKEPPPPRVSSRRRIFSAQSDNISTSFESSAAEARFVSAQRFPKREISSSLDVRTQSGEEEIAGGAPKSEGRVNYWRRNSRHELVLLTESDSMEEPVARAPTTQIWAIDPSAFGSTEKLSTTNGTLRQIFVVNGKDSKSAATNTPPHSYKEGATNTSPLSKKAPRGRSFSPPRSDYDSYDDQEKDRYFSYAAVQRTKREERVRKSFSSEQLSGMERFRKHQQESSAMSSASSSSGSSIRQSGNWSRDLRSGIPVPIQGDNKLKIRSRQIHKTRGPMTIPAFTSVKSPSLQTTPEKFKLPESPNIGRQPFSSGSESSGYFTPPPDTHHDDDGVSQELTPEPTPEPSPEPTPEPTPETTPEPSPVIKHRTTPTPNPERFIQIDSPKNSETTFREPSDESEPEDTLHEDAVEEIKESPKFESKSVTNSMDELDVVNKNLADSLDDTDFTKITFSEKRALSKSAVDITISTHISRKNVNSAPAQNEVIANFSAFDTENVPIKTSLPGSVVDSLEDTQAPEELFNTSPRKSFKRTTLKSSFRRKSCRMSNCLSVDTDTLRPYCKPREALNEIVEQLESPEWEITMKGLFGLMRLIRHHRDLVENNMHNVCTLLGKQVRNLRSQVARTACRVASELFGASKRPLEMELDELAGPLLHRTADTNKFLRSDANMALDEMSANLSVPKVVSVVVYRGCGHQNAVVRCASARLLANLVNKLGPEKVFQLPRDTRDKILSAGAKLLMEGSLETRKHAKMLLGHLSGHCQFQRALAEAVPSSILRHIDKTLRTLI